MKGVLWITGVAGFSGRHLVRHLLGDSERPRIVGLDTDAAAPEGVDTYYQLDLCDPEALAAALGRDAPDWVIHLAGVMPPVEESTQWRVNVGATLTLVRQLAVVTGSRTRFLTVGSAAEFLTPVNCPLREDSPTFGLSSYGRTKWAQSTLALAAGKTLGLPVVVARTFNLIGPGLPDTLVARALCRQFLQTGEDELRVGNLSSKRDFVDVRDAVDAYWRLVRDGRSEEIYNVCTGVPVSVADLINTLSEITGRQRRLCVDPALMRREDPPEVYGENAKLTATGWQPHHSLRDSLEAMVGERARVAGVSEGSDDVRQ